jgi:hypothetical protein
MRKLAHVPVQTWRGWDPNDLFGGWFSALGGVKTLIGTMGLILGAWLTLPAWPPAVCKDYCGGYCRKENSLTCNDAMKYKPLDQDDAL